MRSGDSGGAVYTVNSDGSVAAKGIHNSSDGGGLTLTEAPSIPATSISPTSGTRTTGSPGY
jgi:hypothetical protein